jgi:hypothetical protein
MRSGRRRMIALVLLAVLSEAHVEPDLTIELFLMDEPLAGFRVLAPVDPPPTNLSCGRGSTGASDRTEHRARSSRADPNGETGTPMPRSTSQLRATWAAGVLLTATATIGSLCYAGWAMGDSLIARRPPRPREAAPAPSLP